MQRLLNWGNFQRFSLLVKKLLAMSPTSSGSIIITYLENLVLFQDLLASKRLVYSSTVELTRRDSNFDATLHDETYDPEDLIPDSDLINQFVYENDPDCPIEGASLSRKKVINLSKCWDRHIYSHLLFF